VRDQVISSTEAPEETVYSMIVFTLYIADIQYNSEFCTDMTLKSWDASVLDKRMRARNWWTASRCGQNLLNDKIDDCGF